MNYSQTVFSRKNMTAALMLVGVVGFGPLANADMTSKPAASSQNVVENNPDVAPDVLVSKATDALLHRINTATSEEKSDGIRFYEHLVGETVGPFVDFETIAKRVMGKSAYLEANDDQRAAFVETFKRSLITTYAKGISTYDDQTIKITPYEGIQEKRGVARAKVELEIQPKGGKPFPIVYSMFQDDARGWLLENMHLDGVNVGSTFRNQFKQALKDNQGNLDKVIESWGAGS